MNLENKTIAPSSAGGGSAAIAAKLRRAILDGAYLYRDRLPSERELAEHFGASRSTVREALRQLEEVHLVSRRIGSGTFVTHDSEFGGTNIAEVTSPLQLIEVRFAIEPHMTRLAVANASARPCRTPAHLPCGPLGGENEWFTPSRASTRWVPRARPLRSPHASASMA